MSNLDDFDDAFSDLGPAATVAPSTTTLPAGSSADEFDFDEDAFSFRPDFDAPQSSTGATSPPASAAAFDESFADFDSSFEPATGKAEGGAFTDSPAGFSFVSFCFFSSYLSRASLNFGCCGRTTRLARRRRRATWPTRPGRLAQRVHRRRWMMTLMA
jgi:hypothetical protein